ncbi:MAG: protein-tyrosine phosphatase family protein [Pseudomonadota bacterium]
MDDFAIYDLPLLAGTVGISPIPGRTRHYPADFDRLIDWGPDAVVTMTTPEELLRKGAQSLGRDLAARGIGWHSLPVTDYGTPDDDVRARWPGVSTNLRKILADGGRVLVHCFGGCGRSGMAILRLMVDAGEIPEAALARLRQVRPCAVETDGQYTWASGAVG